MFVVKQDYGYYHLKSVNAVYTETCMAYSNHVTCVRHCRRHFMQGSKHPFTLKCRYRNNVLGAGRADYFVQCLLPKELENLLYHAQSCVAGKV